MPGETSRDRIHPREAEGRPLQYRDIDRPGQKLARERWAAIGNAASEGIPRAMAQAAGGMTNPAVSAEHRKKSRRRFENLQELEPHVVDRPLDLTSAARRQVGLSRQAGVRGAETGDIRFEGDHPSGRPLGSGWYFKHADALHHIARGTGFDTQRIIDASVALSPQNDPENEKAAISALASAHAADHPVTATSMRGAKLLGVADIGMSKRFSELSSQQIASLSGTKSSGHVQSKANLYDMGKGGSGLLEGIQVLRGEKDPETVGKDTAKVPSYRASLHNAHNASPAVRTEYHRRVQEGIGVTPYHEQPTIFGADWEADPTGMASSTEGVLSPTAHTAQDTWMQAMNMRQPAEAVAIGERGTGRVGKNLGSDPSIMKMSTKDVYPTPAGHKKLSSAELVHAMGNEATIRSAAMITRQAEARGGNVGAGFPALAQQEIPWSEYRVQLGKDPLWEKAEQAALPAAPTQIKGQREMFTPAGGITSAAHTSRDQLQAGHARALAANEATIRKYGPRTTAGKTPEGREIHATAHEGAERNRRALSQGQFQFE